MAIVLIIMLNGHNSAFLVNVLVMVILYILFRKWILLIKPLNRTLFL